MKFKTKRQEDEFTSGHMSPLLKKILLDVETYNKDRGCNDLTITSIYRTPSEDAALHGSGIHATIPNRAADIRIKCWDDPNALALAALVNSNYIYDPSRPSLKVAFMEPHGDGPHVHFQVHSRTQLR